MATLSPMLLGADAWGSPDTPHCPPGVGTPGCHPVPVPLQGLVATLHEGDDFGQLALVNDAPRAASIILREDNCHFLRVDKQDFNHILKVGRGPGGGSRAGHGSSTPSWAPSRGRGMRKAMGFVG